MDLTDLTLWEASHMIAEKRLSPVELVRAHLERIQQVEARLNAFITVTEEEAEAQARRVEAAVRRGETLPPLAGCPIAVKDLYLTQGVRTTAGSRFFQASLPVEDAAAIQRVKTAGAVLLGKLNMHEVALGLTGVNPHFGACRNPWDTARITGGSSSGSAAALAARLCLGSLGSDTGGSIRVPSGLCGVVGLKPTYGRVSLHGVIPLSWTLDHAGPMARNVKDVALLLQVIAGYDPRDPVSIDRPVDDYLAGLEQGVAGWRIGLVEAGDFGGAEPEILAAVTRAAEQFASLGARVEVCSVPWAQQAARANSQIIVCDAAAYHRERLASQPEWFGEDVRQRLENGTKLSGVEVSLARRLQSELRRQFENLFEGFDLLLTPTTAIPAGTIEESNALVSAPQLTHFTSPFNLSGLPAISTPCGFTSGDLPIGMQLIGAPWSENRLLRAAFAYEQSTDWHTLAPKL